MSQHKTTQSNWTTEEQKLYRERRDKNLRGQVSTSTVYRTIKDEDGNEQRVPLGVTTGSHLSRGKQPSARAQKRDQWKAWRRGERKGSTRGE